MLCPPFLKEFEQRLLHHPRIPRRYARRVMDELADHYFAIEQNLLDAGRDRDDAARLAQQQLAADPDVLIEQFARSRFGQSGGFACRFIVLLINLAREHALSAFGLLPILAFLGTLIATKFVGVMTYIFVCDWLHVPFMNQSFVFIVDKIFYTSVYVIPGLMALSFCKLAQRANRSIGLAFFSCAIISVMGGMLKLDLVQCAAGQHVAYFQRFGADVPRLAVPMLIFVVHSALRTLRPIVSHASA